MTPSSLNDIRSWLIQQVADLLGVTPDEIDPSKSLESFGIASRDAITLVGDLESWTGLSLSPTLVYEYPTIDAIARRIAALLKLGDEKEMDAGGRTVPMPELRRGGHDEPIAIVGLGCRFPGADDPDSFWQLLKKGVDAITETPPDRWDAEAIYEPRGGPGKIVSKWGGFLPDIAEFDSAFFGISPREAEHMDPQQRLLLEVSWEAMEHAGIPLAQLRGNNVGVFVGISNHDYLLLHRGDLKELSPYSGVGNAFSVDANRISFIYDFHGPSVAVDTACSSSLVALHMACQALHSGEADAALAGGVNAILTPEVTTIFSQAGMLSPGGRCRTFDAAADGYVRSEGAGMVLLKRLSDAQRDGDRILAVIRATATNQDGRSNGISAPNAAAQTAVIRTALARAGVSPEQLDYIEAHGTGTRLGDPIEIEGLAAALAGRSLDDPCFVGSVKTNVGHMESAAGIAGLIKTVLALQHEEIPPHLHLRQINPLIPIDDLPIEIPTMVIPWPRESERTRYAGVSSFGFGGANAFVVLEEAPEQPLPVNEIERTAHILSLSAQTPAALDALAARYQAWLIAHPDANLADAAFTANTGRQHFSQRLALVTADRDELIAGLGQAAAGETGVGLRRGRARGGQKPSAIAWLFTGQGAQYADMGRELYETQPTFRDALNHCARTLDDYLEKPLLSVIYPENPDDTAIHDTTYTQPALFAIEYALARLWQSWGLQPDFVIGHSVGEYVAAVIAGVMSLEDGLKLIAARGRLMGALPHDGAMAAVFSDIRTVAAAIAPHMQEVSIAGVNGPKLVVISGKKEPIETISATLKEQGVRVSPLTVSHAFHSPLMDPILDAFEAVAREITFRTPAIPLISNVTGMAIMPGEMIDAGYWRRHIRMAVQFMAGMQTLDRLGAEIFLEVGPHPTLTGMGRRILDDEKYIWTASLHRKKQDWPTILDALAQLYVVGLPVDWIGFDADYQRQRLHLPTYPFQRQRYWHAISLEGIAPRELDHAMLLRRLRSPLLTEPVFEARISLKTHPWLGDHRIGEYAVFPATAYLEMMAAAARQAFGRQTHALQNVGLQEMLPLSEEDASIMQVTLSAMTDGDSLAQVFALDDAAADNWQVKAKASVSPLAAGLPAVDVAGLRSVCTEPVDMKIFYDALARHGLRYGLAFRGVQEAWSGEAQALGRLILPEAAGDAREYLIHPALLDAAFHVVAAALGEAEDDAVFLPVAVARYQVLASPNDRIFWSHAVLRPDAPGDLVIADVQLLDDAGRVLADVQGLQVAPVSADALLRGLSRQRIDDWLYRQEWRPQPLTAPVSVAAASGWWLLFADASGSAQAVAEGLRAGGDDVVMVMQGESFGATGAIWTVNPFHADEFGRLLAALQPQHPLPPRGVIYAWGLDVDDQGGAALAGALHLTQKLLLAGWREKPRLYALTASAQNADGSDVDAAAAPLWGFGAVAALEHPELAPTMIDLPDVAGAALSQLIEELLADDVENRVALRGGGRFVARLAREVQRTSSNAAFLPRAVADDDHQAAPGSLRQVRRTSLQRLEIPQRGQLSNLTLSAMRRTQPGPGQIEIQVRATGLNFRDVMNALGLYPGDPGPLGGECAGVVSAVGPGVEHLQVGDAVMGIVPASFASYAITDARLVVKKPENLTFAEAATIPIAFLTAHYALNRLGAMQAGERVFIHSASGGVGLAAVQLAQRAGLEIFGAAGSDAKRDYLRSIGVHHVYNSRSLDFADGALADSQGQGVHLVLNSLAGDVIPANLKMLAPNGRFLEIGKVGVWSPEKMAELRPDIAYHIIALDALSAEQPASVGEMLAELAQAFAADELHPLHHRTYPLEQSEAAFRFMAMAKHIGKIVITQSAHDLPATHRPPVHIRADGAYLITGGLGALGRLVAEWLIEQGAGAVGLLSRHAPDVETRRWMDGLAAGGSQVMHLQADVTLAPALENAISSLETSTSLPLRGVIHAAGALDDGVILQQTWERFQKVLAPKIAGAANLHHLTRHADLDFFILFSSIASVLGSPGQSNYAAANAYLDALAVQRRKMGLPGLSINWGPWEAGMAADDQQGRRTGRGLWPIPVAAGLQALDALLNADWPQVAVMSVNWPTFLQAYRQTPPLLADFAPVAPAAAQAAAAQGPSDILLALQDAPADEHHYLLTNYLREQVRRILGLSDIEQVDAYAALSEMGMDSLMAVELKNALDEATSKNLPATIAFEYPTITAIANYLLNDVLLLSFEEPDAASADEAIASDTSTQMEEKIDLPDLDALSDEELEALLAEKLDDFDDLEDR